MSKQQTDTLARTLADWYVRSARALSFRETKNPYAIWVSEIMAQQTRITALLPYFTRFMAAYPTVYDLAAAQEADVLKLWEGLGYYARARHLRAAARRIVEEHQGRMPDDVRTLRTLPGIGDYTAGAIASIAYGRKTPAVDGNVLRVFARLTCYEEDIGKPAAKRAAGAWVSALMEATAPGLITEALMELGALICIPKEPRCMACELTAFCQALAQEKTRNLPVKTPKKPQRMQIRPVFVLVDEQGRVLLRRRTERLLHGLWEFPDALPPGAPIITQIALGSASHQFTHIRWELEGTLVFTRRFTPPDGFVWLTRDEWRQAALPRAFARYQKALEEYWETGASPL